jgi:hypothetical protein
MLWSHTQGFRSQLAIGLVSIVLSLYLLLPDPDPQPLTRREWLSAAGVVLATAGFYLWIGVSLQHIRNVFPKMVPLGGGRFPVAMQLVTALIALQVLLLLLGKRRIFAGVLASELLLTAGNFNPLSIGFPRVEASPLYKAVQRVVDDERANGLHSLWVASGGPTEPMIGTLLTAMGARALTGVHFHPQLALWHALDPSGYYQSIYNRYAEIAYLQLPLDDQRIEFKTANDGSFNVRASPIHPLLKRLGVRYALTYGKDGSLTQPPFTRLYSGKDKPFRIWRLPTENE